MSSSARSFKCTGEDMMLIASFMLIGMVVIRVAKSVTRLTTLHLRQALGHLNTIRLSLIAKSHKADQR
jgi:hypothetical protein